jgi:hypothetical protein
LTEYSPLGCTRKDIAIPPQIAQIIHRQYEALSTPARSKAAEAVATGSNGERSTRTATDDRMRRISCRFKYAGCCLLVELTERPEESAMPTTLNDLAALKGKFVISSKAGSWQITCSAPECVARWRLEKDSDLDPENLLQLLNHAALHRLSPEELQNLKKEAQRLTRVN